MDIDNIMDIEVLREAAKYGRVKMKKDCYSTDGHIFIFKKDMWYHVDQDESGVTITSDDNEHYCDLSYEESDRYLYKDDM